jgi:hypothetical protein
MTTTTRFPSTVLVCSKPYTVAYVLKPGDVPHSGRGSLHGEVDVYHRSIHVLWKPGMHTDALHTLLHELLHAITFELSLEAGEAADWEAEVNRVATGLVDLLLRNHWLADDPWKIGFYGDKPDVNSPTIAGRVYTVEWYDDAEEVEPDTGEAMTAWCCTTTKVIRLFRHDSAVNRQHLFLRECVRCLTYEMRLGAFEGRAHELGLLCGAVADTLLRNGWVVELEAGDP